MTFRTVARLTGALFFCIWLGILYVGADHPPPPGFALVVVLDAVAAVLVSFRMLSYLEWAIQRRAHRLARVFLDGLVVGLVFAAIPFLLRLATQGVSQSLMDAVIWFTVIGSVGVANAFAIYLCSVSLLKVVGIPKRSVVYPQRDKRDS